MLKAPSPWKSSRGRFKGLPGQVGGDWGRDSWKKRWAFPGGTRVCAVMSFCLHPAPFVPNKVHCSLLGGDFSMVMKQEMSSVEPCKSSSQGSTSVFSWFCG